MARIGIIGNAGTDKVFGNVTPGRKNRRRAARRAGGFVVGCARGAAALGLEPVVFTSIGQDAAGDFIEQELRALGADVRGVRRCSLPTATSIVIVDGDIRTTLHDDGEPFAYWRLTSADRDLLAWVDVIAAGGTLDHDGTNSVTTQVFDAGGELGKPLCCNFTRLADLGSLDLTGCKLFQVSHDDLENFGFQTDLPAAAVADEFLKAGGDSVVVTYGPDGQRGFNHAESVRMWALPIAKAAHPVGAGEAAFVGHLAGMLSGASMYDWLDIGAIAGGFFVEHGRHPGWAEIDAIRRKTPPHERV